MKKIKWNIVTSALLFQLLLERDQSWKNKSKPHNVLSLEISFRSHWSPRVVPVSILFFFRLLQTTWPSQKTDQIYIGKAKHVRCNLMTQQKRLTHVLKCVEDFLALAKVILTYISRWLAKCSSSSFYSAYGDRGLKQARKIFSNKFPCIFSTWPNWTKEVFFGRGRHEWCKVRLPQIALSFNET